MTTSEIEDIRGNEVSIASNADFYRFKSLIIEYRNGQIDLDFRNNLKLIKSGNVVPCVAAIFATFSIFGNISYIYY